MRLTAPDESFPAEVAALRFWAGRGTVLLVETDLGAGTMLLERLDPTRSLATLPLAEANHHAGRMMRRLAVPAPSDSAPVSADQLMAASRRDHPLMPLVSLR